MRVLSQEYNQIQFVLLSRICFKWYMIIFNFLFLNINLEIQVKSDFTTCEDEDDCSSQFKCLKMEECSSSKICWHQPFYEQVDYQRFLSYPILLMIIGFSNFVGMGAEMMKVIVNMGMLDYPSYDSTIFSYFCTLGCSLVLIIFIVIQNQRILVDFELVLFLYPSIIIGTELGNYYNRAVPDFIGVLIITLISLIMFVFLLKESNIIYQAEKDEYLSQQQIEASLQHVANLIEHKSESIHLQTNQNRLRKQKPFFIAILITFIIYQSTIIFRGGRKVNFFVAFGNQKFWLVTFIIFAITIFIFAAILCYLQKKQREDRIRVDPDYFNSRSYSKRNISLIVLIGAIGCLLSGLIGVGIAITIVPLCIISNDVFKLPPRQIACTSTFCLLLMSISTTIQTFLNPAANLADSIFYFFLGVISTLLITIPLFQVKFKQTYMQLIIKLRWDTQIVIIILILLCITFIIGTIEVIINFAQLGRIFVPECDKK
ncbi:hypothetical protein pb186bvf_017120 [Paramecium bursaria]